MVRESRSTRDIENRNHFANAERYIFEMIKKVKGGYRLYSRKKNPTTHKRRNLLTFKSKAGPKKHEKAVQYFKRR